METLSARKFSQKYDLDLIIASHAGIHVGDMVWDAAGIVTPTFDRPGAPTNVFNAFEIIGEIDSDERVKMQDRAATLPLVTGAMANTRVHVDAEHIGSFQYPGVVAVASDISLEKISSFSFSNIQVREMPNDMRIRIDRHLDNIKQRDWKKYDMTIRRSFILTETYHGEISVSLDMRIAEAADVQILTNAGFTLKSQNTVLRTEVYSMAVNGTPFAMRTERLRRFAA